jgi:glycosyltransferase involved in cell wall biosynthesis
VKNAEATIGKCIDSVLDQDYPHQLIEIVVVDGLSKDRTISILIEKLEKTDIRRKILSDNGKGLGAARNLVCMNSRSKYVLWIDGDIVIPKGHVREQIAFMEKNPRIGAAKATYGFSYTGNVVADSENLRTLTPSLIARARASKSSNFAGTGAAIFRLEALEQADYFDERIKGAGEDIDMAVRINLEGWNLSTSPAIFYENFRETWKDLWREYYWWGYGMHYVANKHEGTVALWTYFPPIAFLKDVFKALAAVKLTHKVCLIIIPFHSFYKTTAWLSGFLHSHFDKYGHKPLSLPRFRIFGVWPVNTRKKPGNLPKVTVGIVVKNSESTIGEALASLSRQNYPKELLEIVAIDNRSVDSTPLKMRRFAESSPHKMKILTAGPGLGLARQIAVDNASGKYIVWIDGDMTVPENHIMDQVTFLENQSRTAIAKGKEIASIHNVVSKIESYRPLLQEFRRRDFSIGTGGATFLVRVLRGVGNFDPLIRGAGEDVDVVRRIQAAGWSTAITPAIFYHKLKTSWRGLWKQYFWYGYGMHFIRHKYKGVISTIPYFPIFSLALGYVHCFIVFRKTREKTAFLLPLQYIFKRTAWLMGYLRGHFDHYQSARANSLVPASVGWASAKPDNIPIPADYSARINNLII